MIFSREIVQLQKLESFHPIVPLSFRFFPLNRRNNAGNFEKSERQGYPMLHNAKMTLANYPCVGLGTRYRAR